MVTAKKNDQKVEEKTWEDPSNPEKTGDERDQEQLLRQYEEAKRRNENLTDTDKNKQN